MTKPEKMLVKLFTITVTITSLAAAVENHYYTVLNDETVLGYCHYGSVSERVSISVREAQNVQQ